MKKTLLLSVIASLSLAATIMPYTSYMTYNNSTKDKAYLAGMYMSDFKLPFKYEIDLEGLKLKYKNKYNIADYNERDLTFVLNYFRGYNYIYKFGIHNIFIDQSGSNDTYDKVLFTNFLYYKYLKYNVGASYYFGSYDGFNTNQVTLKGGYNFGNYYSKIGSFYTELKANFIKISDKNKAYTNKDNYQNFDIKLQNFNGAWTTTLKYSTGKNAYKVANNGFVVYNLGSEYKSVEGIDINYKFAKTNNIKIGFSHSSFDTDSSSNSYLLSYAKSF